MVLSWLTNRTNPIAVDVGADTIKLLQAEPVKSGGGENEPQFKLIAADCQVIPENIRSNLTERDNFVSDAIRKMLTNGFRGKQVVTCIPSNHMAMQHVRMAKMSEKDFAKALEFYLKALVIREKNLGGEHPDTITVKRNICDLKSYLKILNASDNG